MRQDTPRDATKETPTIHLAKISMMAGLYQAEHRPNLEGELIASYDAVQAALDAAERQAAELAALRDWQSKAKEVIGALNAEMPYYRLVCLEDCQSKQGGICDCGAASLRAIAESVDALLA